MLANLSELCYTKHEPRTLNPTTLSVGFKTLSYVCRPEFKRAVSFFIYHYTKKTLKLQVLKMIDKPPVSVYNRSISFEPESGVDHHAAQTLYSFYGF